MKNFFLALTFVLMASYCHGQAIPQKDYSVSAGVDMGYAVGGFHFAHTLGFGVSVQGEYLFSDNASMTLNTGYISFASKTFTDSVSADIVTSRLEDFSTVPFLFGVKIDYEGRFYVHPQVGIAFRSDPFISACYSLGVGISKSKHSDFSIRYQGTNKKGVVASFIAVRAAYIF